MAAVGLPSQVGGDKGCQLKVKDDLIKVKDDLGQR
jgi:hypothetical protein